jgi:plasmid stabilization system protein ParE
VAEVHFHPEAHAEFLSSLAWYGSRSLRAAERFLAEVERVVGQIADQPDFYPRYDNYHRFAVLRRFPFSVVYQDLPSQVYVVAIAHSSRSPGYWQSRS